MESAHQRERKRQIKCLRVSFSVVGVFFLVVGLALLIIGVKIFDTDALTELTVIGVSNMPWAMRATSLACGCLVWIFSVVGLAGVWREGKIAKTVVIVFCCLLGLLLFVAIAAIALTAIYMRRTQTWEFQRAAENIQQFYGLRTNDSGLHRITAAVDSLQTKLKCCGWSAGDGNPNIFTSTPWHLSQAALLDPSEDPVEAPLYPESCCTASAGRSPDDLAMCTKTQDEPEARINGYMHHEDCVDHFFEKNELHSKFALGFTGGVICLLVVELVLAIRIVLFFSAPASPMLRKVTKDTANACEMKDIAMKLRQTI